MKDKNLQLIQMLRAIAALLVVFFHATGNLNETLKTNFFFNFFRFGGAGVDIFFVLSGFIITYTSLKNIQDPKKFTSFVYRRFVRIFPTYWIIISAFLLLQVLLPSFYKTNYNFDITNLLKTYFLLPNHVMVNGVSWTLTSELFFYFLFSLAFMIRDIKADLGFVVIYSIIVIALPLFGYDYKNENGWLSLVTFPMNIEFFLGIFSVVLISFIPKTLSASLIIFGSILFILDGIILNSGYQLFPNSFNRVVLFGLPAFFIITGALKYELTSKISIPKIFLKLGNASYSLYLLHLPVIAACCKLLLLLNIHNNLALHIILLTAIVIICFASILFYTFIEKPIIATLNNIRRINVAGEI